MARSDRILRVTQSRVMRTYLLAFIVIWVLILFGFTAGLAAHGNALVILPTALIIVLISIGVRALRVAAIGDRELLTVRNYFGTVKMRRRQIRSFQRNDDPKTRILGSTVQVVLIDGSTQSVDLFTRPLLTQGSRDRFDATLKEMREWLR